MTIQPEMDFTKGPELNAEKGKMLRDTGIGMAVDHAEQVQPGWGEQIYEVFVNKFLLNQNGPFMMEEFRSYCALMDLPMPPHNRAFAGIIMKAVKAGIIQRVGFKNTRNPKSHRTPASVWQQVKPSQQ